MTATMAAEQFLYNPCVLYSLPKDVTTQAISEKSIERALQKVKDFLLAVADVSEIEFYTLVAHIPQPHARYYQAGLKMIAEAKARFGPGVESPVGYHYPSGEALVQKKIEWEFKPTSAAGYVDFIAQQQPIPAYELPLFEIIGAADFYLVDEKKSRLPGQTHQSSLMVWLGRNSAISPTLWLPFAELTDEFMEYKELVADKFPGKFNEKYLRKIKPSKDGLNYQVRKL